MNLFKVLSKQNIICIFAKQSVFLRVEKKVYFTSLDLNC